MKKHILLIGFFILTLLVIFISKNLIFNLKHNIGDEIDHFNGVAVYYNGHINNIEGRALTEDGYNLGLKFQCVEFVKRYYYEALNHKMPETYGHANDFYNPKLNDGQKNKQRGLTQYSNPSKSIPKVNDLLVYSGTLLNSYGHVSIVTKVTNKHIEIIQQNSGVFGNSRERYALIFADGFWKIDNSEILGWLRK